MLRWVTTRYRISDGQIELRRGLLNKQTTTARLDKVRTVDLTAQLHHRVLGLAKVEISTGGRPARTGSCSTRWASTRGVGCAPSCCTASTPRSPAYPRRTGAPRDLDALGLGDAAAPRADEEVLLRLDPSWIRYAPLTMTGIATAAAIFGFVTQGFTRFGTRSELIVERAAWVRGLAWWIDGMLVARRRLAAWRSAPTS